MSALRQITDALAAPTGQPPLYRATAGRLGFRPDAEADRVQRWIDNAYLGHWTDPEYDELFDGGDQP